MPNIAAIKCKSTFNTNVLKSPEKGKYLSLTPLCEKTSSIRYKNERIPMDFGLMNPNAWPKQTKTIRKSRTNFFEKVVDFDPISPMKSVLRISFQ